MLLLTIIQIAIILLNVLWCAIIIHVILGLLVSFNVVNRSNELVRGLLQGLDRFLEPLYRPIRKILPDFGGIDFSPFVVLLTISILSQVVLPNLAMSLPPAGTS